MLENRDQGATVERRRVIAYAISLVWLLFLTFPLVTAFQGGPPTLAGALSILLTLAFAALYAISMIRHFRDPDRITESLTWQSVAFIALLIAMCVAQMFLIGTDAFSLAVFVVPVTVFLLPPAPRLHRRRVRRDRDSRLPRIRPRVLAIAVRHHRFGRVPRLRGIGFLHQGCPRRFASRLARGGARRA